MIPNPKLTTQFSKLRFSNVLKFKTIQIPDQISILFLVETASGVKGHFVDASGMYASWIFFP